MSANASSADRLPNIFSIFLILLGLYLVPPSFQKLYLIHMSQEWLVAEGRVISAEVEPRWPAPGGRVPEYQTRVWYSYSVGEKNYVGKTLRLVERYSRGRQAVEERLKNYPVGGRVEVKYSPKDPAMAVVEKTDVPLADVLKLSFGGLFLITGILAFGGLVAPEKYEA